MLDLKDLFVEEPRVRALVSKCWPVTEEFTAYLDEFCYTGSREICGTMDTDDAIMSGKFTPEKFDA